MRWISTLQPLTLTFSTTSRSRRRRPSKSSSSNEAAIRFGGEHEILANNIAWILRHMPIFAIPGNGRYAVQPVDIDDLVQICLNAADADGNVILDAAGPETMTFEELVQAIRRATGSRAPIVHIPPIAMAAAARALGLLVRDVGR